MRENAIKFKQRVESTGTGKIMKKIKIKFKYLRNG
jgi:hypothetical protein